MTWVRNITVIINPILLLILVVGVTMLLFTENEKVTTLKNQSKALHTGVGTELVAPLPIIDWQPYYNGGQGIDSVIAISEGALRVSTGADGEWYGALAELGSDVNLSEQTISFAVNSDDWEALDRLVLLFSTDENFTDYYGLNLTNYFAFPVDDEWNRLVLERSVFEVIEGSPDWSEITHIAVRVVPEPGISTRVWFDDFQIVTERADSPIITLAFDDGFGSVAEVADSMTKYDFVGAAFVTPRLLGTEGYLTQPDVEYLHNLGWDISGHSNLQLTKLIPSDVDTELALVYEYLDNNNYTGRTHFAYPNGSYNLSAKSQVLEYFTSARTIDGFSQPTELAYPENINAITVASSTSVTEVVRIIEQAKSDNTWLILVWHDFNMNPEKDVEYLITDFEWLMKYIHDSGIEVVSYSEAYERLYQQDN